MLYNVVRGHGPALVLVHGFTQSASAWGLAGDRLADACTTIALDAPGHGHSAGVEAGLVDGAALMAETVAAVGSRLPEGPPAWLGYSMGGRYALNVALYHPEVVGRLVLVSATGGIDDPDERAARRRADAALADRVTTEGLEPFVRWWLAQPLFASLPEAAAQMEGRLDGTAAGLASSLRRAGTGSQEPLWERLGEIRVPVLVIAGERDSKYRALGQRLAGALGGPTTLAVVEGAGHACHLEQPEAVADTVVDWLHRTTA